MTYSLLNAPALAFDLVRRAHGATTAVVLVAALTAEQDDLVVAARSCTPQTGTHVDRVAELRGLVEREILGPGSPADSLSGEQVDRLRAGFGGAVARAWEAEEVVPGAELLPSWLPVPRGQVDLGPRTRQVRKQLDMIAAARDHDRHEWRIASGRACGPTDWASAMHQAAWAVELSGRSRAAAVAQLLAVQAYRAGGFTCADTRQGVWNLVSGVVQALVVADLLPSIATRQLVLPWTDLTSSPRGV